MNGYHVMVPVEGKHEYVPVIGYFPWTSRKQRRRAHEMSKLLKSIGIPSHVLEGDIP